jgi:hypothetical protein
MNIGKRKEFKRILDDLQDLINDAENLRTQEQVTLEAYPENLQGSARCQNLEASISLIEDFINALEDAQTIGEGIE